MVALVFLVKSLWLLIKIFRIKTKLSILNKKSPTAKVSLTASAANGLTAKPQASGHTAEGGPKESASEQSNYKINNKNMNLKNINYLLIGLILCVFTFSSCSSDSAEQPVKKKYIEEGLDKIVKANRDVDNYTVLLWDMDFKDEKYMHKYMVVSAKMDSVVEKEESDWLEVSPEFFQANENNLDMELASKTDGKLSKEVAPPGFSQYVGNEKYGKWEEQDNGDRMWAFAGRYAFMSLMFHSMMTPRYSSYNTYRGSYRGTGRPYYGSGGSQYGTSKSLASGSARKTNWSSKPATFRDKVRTQVRQSTSASRAPSNSAKTQRNTNRKTPTNSSRSRGGGFGK